MKCDECDEKKEHVLSALSKLVENGATNVVFDVLLCHHWRWHWMQFRGKLSARKKK